MSAFCTACGDEAWETTAAACVLDPAAVTAARLHAVKISERADRVRALLAPVARRVLRAGVPICDLCSLAEVSL